MGVFLPFCDSCDPDFEGRGSDNGTFLCPKSPTCLTDSRKQKHLDLVKKRLSDPLIKQKNLESNRKRLRDPHCGAKIFENVKKNDRKIQLPSRGISMQSRSGKKIQRFKKETELNQLRKEKAKVKEGQFSSIVKPYDAYINDYCQDFQ